MDQNKANTLTSKAQVTQEIELDMLRLTIRRTYTSLNRPGPLPLGNKKQHKEMLDMIRKKQNKDANSTGSDLHDDAIKKPKPEFTGDVNPKTGEVNGPKNEPTKHNDWSFGGRVTDF